MLNWQDRRALAVPQPALGVQLVFADGAPGDPSIENVEKRCHFLILFYFFNENEL